MSIEKVREYFREYDMEDKVLEFEVSSATVRLAAIALGTEEARIAKQKIKVIILNIPLLITITSHLFRIDYEIEHSLNKRYASAKKRSLVS